MSENTCSLFGVLLFIIALICAVSCLQQQDELKAEAVKRGFAEWIVIGQNQTEFKWKEHQ
jgi:hypothetical protein